MEDPPILSVVVPEGAPRRLDKALADAAPVSAALSRSRIKALIESGAVVRSGAPVTDAKSRVAPGEVYDILLPPPRPMVAEPEAIALNIVHEDDDLVVIDKPVGMVVHPAPGAPSGTLVNALLYHCGSGLSGIGGVGRPGIVHRIDKDTSGLLVVAKTDRAHQGLAAQFADHSVERMYDAICWGAPDVTSPRLAGLDGITFERDGALRVDLPLGRHPADRKKMAVVAEGRHAISRFWTRQVFGPAGRPVAARLSCRLETGRTHQIRVHAQAIGHPLVGDPVYARSRAIGRGSLSQSAADALRGFPRQALHAASLGFTHPVTGGTLIFVSNPPEDVTSLLRNLAEKSG